MLPYWIDRVSNVSIGVVSIDSKGGIVCVVSIHSKGGLVCVVNIDSSGGVSIDNNGGI